MTNSHLKPESLAFEVMSLQQWVKPKPLHYEMDATDSKQINFIIIETSEYDFVVFY